MKITRLFSIVVLLLGLTLSSEVQADFSVDTYDQTLGVRLGVGVPEGVDLSAVLYLDTFTKYLYWASLHGGIASNVIGIGFHSGVTADFIPLVVGLPLSVSGGFYPQTEPGRLIEPADHLIVRYRYINYRAGLRVGNLDQVRFILYGGLSTIWFDTTNFQTLFRRVEGLKVKDPSGSLIIPTVSMVLDIPIY